MNNFRKKINDFKSLLIKLIKHQTQLTQFCVRINQILSKNKFYQNNNLNLFNSHQVIISSLTLSFD